MQNAQLLSHVDTDLVTRDQLRLVPVPEPTRTWRSIPHIELVESLEQVLQQNQIAIQGEQFALRRDGLRSSASCSLSTRTLKMAGRQWACARRTTRLCPFRSAPACPSSFATISSSGAISSP